MRKYWYYTYKTLEGIGSDICSSDCGEFDIAEETKRLLEERHQPCVITYWHEISVNQYEKMKEYLENR